MAVQYQSSANSSWATATSWVVTKPTGLAVGDLMIGILATNASSPGFPSGFSNPLDIQVVPSGGNHGLMVAYKVADSGDVAATDFTFSDSSQLGVAAILRVSGQTINTGAWKNVTGTQLDTDAPSVSAGLTPAPQENSLLIQIWVSRNSTTAHSGYAIVTSNPSWTEVLDVANSTTTNISVAYAGRPEVTGTGAFSCAGGGAGVTDWSGVLLSIAPPFITTTTEGVTLTETPRENIAENTVESVTLTEDIDITPKRWTNQTKNSSSWTNLNKN